MPPRGTTIGIWIGEDESLVEEFDNQLGQRPDYSRSEEVKAAMRLLLAVDDVLAEPVDDLSGPELRHYVRQALLDKDRREAAASGSSDSGLSDS